MVQSFRFLLSQQLCLRLYRVQFPYPLIHNQGQKEDGEYPSVRGRETSSARVDTHRANACKTNSVKVWSLLPVQSCPPPPPQSNLKSLTILKEREGLTLIHEVLMVHISNALILRYLNSGYLGILSIKCYFFLFWKFIMPHCHWDRSYVWYHQVKE